MDNLNTDNLMKLQVQQLEKEKRDQAERIRVISKRLDHTERAYRKEERPLLDEDYDRQKLEDRLAFEKTQKLRVEEYKLAHQRDLDTKRRLSRMMEDFNQRKQTYINARGEAYAKKIKEAEAKIAEEKEKRRKTVMKAREDARKAAEEEERLRREQEEEERRLEEGKVIQRFLCSCSNSIIIRTSC